MCVCVCVCVCVCKEVKLCIYSLFTCIPENALFVFFLDIFDPCRLNSLFFIPLF